MALQIPAFLQVFRLPIQITSLMSGLLIAGTPQAVKDYVKELIDIFGDNGGLIVDGAVDGIPPESKPENVEAMVEAVFKYGVY